MPTGADHLQIAFEVAADRGGVVVSDPIERSQFVLSAPGDVRLRDADPEAFRFPADEAVTVRTDRLDLETVVSVCVRDGNGEMLAQAEHFADQTFPAGTYSVELFAPIKLYLRVDSSLRVVSDATKTSLEFGGETEVLIGARSHHKRPAATVRTTDRPRDAMRAVSLLGSALKTTSVERSYPTLRGHPPLVERGDRFAAPDGIERPETGVTLELPATRRHVYVAAPLAYYLGAEVVPGATPRIVTDEGFVHELDGSRGFERSVERVLKQTFFLDCLTRTEGYYAVDLHERAVLEPELGLEFASLYDRSIGEQLETYLDVPYERIESHVPDWKLTAHVAPTASNVELLPFVANDLAVVMTPRTEPTTGSAIQSTAVADFARGASPRPTADRSSGTDRSSDGELAFTRSASTRSTDTRAQEAASAQRTYVQPPETDSLEQAWLGPGIPIGASKASLQAYRNRLSRVPVEGDIRITVVCNDRKMAEERDAVEAVYGSREKLPFEVETHYELTVEELRSVLKEKTEFLHYIGHIDESGFQCPDGALDVETIDELGVDSFLLNACQSYEQGMELIERGAIAGIVTLNDVVNSGAVDIGRSLARLLNYGFPIRSALELAQRESAIGHDYIVVGDGSLLVTQVQAAFPNSCRIIENDDGNFDVKYTIYPGSEFDIGSLVMPYISGNDQHYISPGTIDSFELTPTELEAFLGLENIPVIIDSKLRWSSTVGLDSF
ncbi:hypothetical protein [Halobellus rufus]|uniref:hypothetical protein n=1 Tax=Halobellus rufus TaxID=1448860 RepID=UPI0006797FB2|nr:hypothetical protein [Halobellus rufus]